MVERTTASLDTFLYDFSTVHKTPKKSLLPKKIRRVAIPPIKCQGIKSKLVPFIFSNVQWSGDGIWYEPFMGSGVVGLNLRPKKAVFSDTNPHLIQLYQQIQQKKITPNIVEKFLKLHGKKLARGNDSAESYYYEMRDQFNQHHDSLHFLFLNRSCFNGLMRFNAKGEFNASFGRKPERFSSAYITKICNQIKWLQELLVNNSQIQFRCCVWNEIQREITPNDFVYLDPPYFGRNDTYYDQWSEQNLVDLVAWSQSIQCGWAISLWYENEHRKNTFVDEQWANEIIRFYNHYYFIGSHEEMRKKIVEALFIKRGYAPKISN